MDIKVTYDEKSSILTIGIDGELDASSAIKMDNSIKKVFNDGYYNIFVDCKLLHYISSAGLGVFVSYQQDIMDNKGQFVFHSMNNKVYNVFEVLGLHSIFNIVADEKAAKNFILLKNEN